MYLLHPRIDFTETTISQNYYWPILRDDIRSHIKVFRNFQKKRKILKYRLSPTKEADAIPRDRLLVDIIIKYKIIREVHYDPW